MLAIGGKVMLNLYSYAYFILILCQARSAFAMSLSDDLGSNADYTTQLVSALEAKQFAEAEKLLKRGADPQTGLICALKQKNPVVIRFMLNYPKTCVNKQPQEDHFGRREQLPLTVALHNNTPEIWQLLLERGADPFCGGKNAPIILMPHHKELLCAGRIAYLKPKLQIAVAESTKLLPPIAGIIADYATDACIDASGDKPKKEKPETTGACSIQ